MFITYNELQNHVKAALDKHGNSVAGVKVLEKLSKVWDLNIY